MSVFSTLKGKAGMITLSPVFGSPLIGCERKKMEQNVGWIKRSVGCGLPLKPLYLPCETKKNNTHILLQVRKMRWESNKIWVWAKIHKNLSSLQLPLYMRHSGQRVELSLSLSHRRTGRFYKNPFATLCAVWHKKINNEEIMFFILFSDAELEIHHIVRSGWIRVHLQCGKWRESCHHAWCACAKYRCHVRSVDVRHPTSDNRSSRLLCTHV